MNVLILDNDFAAAARLNEALAKRGLSAQWSTLDFAKRDQMLSDHFDMIITELAPPPEEPASVVAHAQAKQPQSQVVVYSDRTDIDSAILAMREGAIDYLVKGRDEGRPFDEAIERASVRRGLHVDNQRLLMSLNEVNTRYVDLATRDGLTGLYNFRFFTEYTSKEIERAERRAGRLAIVLVDIDNFKSIGDDYGRRMADEVICAFGETLSMNIRASDLLARSGGSEFVVLLTDTPPQGAEMVAKKLQRMIASTPISVGDVAHRITISAGVAIYPEAGRNFQLLIKSAEDVLRLAKLSGPNHYEMAA